jgi:penicillin-binding protein 2
MIQLPEDRRPPLSPQLALRIAVLGGVALTLFAIVFFRLWFLEVLSGDRYLAQAQNNQERRVVLQAPRGTVLDRNGKLLVDNRAALSIQAIPAKMPTHAAALDRLYRRLNFLLHDSPAKHPCRVGHRVEHVNHLRCLVDQQHYQLPFGNATLETDATRAQYSYFYEHQAEFPGIQAQTTYLRRYPFHGLAAQLFGTVGQINRDELKQKHFKGVHQGTVVGQSGIEYAYDRYLRGQNGFERIAVDALGNAKRFLRKRDPVQGKTLRLSLDLGLQSAGQSALQEGFGLANQNGNPASAGAFVAMDPRNGSVMAMGSLPTFDPNVFAKPITTTRYKQLFGPDAGYPQVNRAIAGAYPTGSTMKLITATAALQSGTITPDTVIDDPGSFDLGGLVLHNAGNASYGALSLRRAIQVSSDVFFYKLGADMNSPKPRGGALQEWARKYGLGRRSGVDLPGESPGNFPSPGWRAKRNEEELRCRKKEHKSSCGLSDLRPWSIGDNVNAAVGQGDVLASPLQMATAYSALVNGGTVVRPHIGLQVENAVGKVLQRIDPRPARHIAIDPGFRQAIMDGLHLAASASGGTSADVWRGFPKMVYGKTGTAQRTGHADQSWYVCYIADGSRPIVIAVTVEDGGFGAQAAAPVARLIASHWFGIKGKVVEGTSRTR